MQNKKLVKNISLFTLFNVINSAIPFLLLPLLTTYLSPEDYGLVDIFYNISLIATPIIGLSVVQAISRYYFEDIDMSRFVTTVFLVLVGTGIICIAASILFAIAGSNFLESYNLPPFLVVFAIVYTLFTQISEIVLTLWRVSYDTLKFGFFRITKTAMDLGFSVLLIVGFKMGWEGRIMPQLLMAILFGVVAIVILYKKGYLLKSNYYKDYKQKALSFSLPLIFHSLGGHIIGFSDRFFILFLLGLGNVGIYSVAYQIGMVIALLQNSFNQAWVPFFFEKLKEDNEIEKRKIVKITYGYFGLLLALVLIFYFATPFIYRYFIGSAFTAGAGVVLWILMGYAFNGMYKMVVNYLFFLKKTKWIAFATLGSAAINLVLNYILIKKNGIEGAAQATTITFLILFVVVFIWSKKSYKMPWRLKGN